MRSAALSGAVGAGKYCGHFLRKASQPPNINMVLRTMGSGASKAPVQQAARLAPEIQVSTTPISTFGSVAQGRGYSSNSRRAPSSVSVNYTNASGAQTELVIGDTAGLVAARTGRAFVQPTTVTGITPAAFVAMLSTMPLLVTGVNYSATAGPTQFPLRFQFNEADISNNYAQDVNINEYVRNTSNDPNLLTLQWGEGFRLDTNSAFTLLVANGQTVSLTFFIGAAYGR